MTEEDMTRGDDFYEEDRGSRCGGNEWWTERSLPVKIVMGIGFGILGIGLMFLFGWVVMILWNWLMPEIFGLTTVTYWQAWGLLVLSCILFKGNPFGSDNGGKRSDRRRKNTIRRYIADEIEKEIDEEVRKEREKAEGQHHDENDME
jgi:hypothetical protein